ncbi:MAG: hypothetical protein CMF59_18525 [Leptospiraceae bacterium]|nr:hypothetical protein [Leptospiraceae bacterium]
MQIDGDPRCPLFIATESSNRKAIPLKFSHKARFPSLKTGEQSIPDSRKSVIPPTLRFPADHSFAAWSIRPSWAGRCVRNTLLS